MSRVESNPEIELINEVYWGQGDFKKAAQKAFARQRKIRKPEGILPEDAIPAYFRRLEKLLGNDSTIDEVKRKRYFNRFLNWVVYPNAVIKPENISDRYIRNIILGNFAEQRGYQLQNLRDLDVRNAVLQQFKVTTGTTLESYNVSPEERQEIETMIIDTQKPRLLEWVIYLTSPEAVQNLPRAFRYWAFAEMTKLGDYDETRKAFNERTETTAAPFPELNQQALSYVFDVIQGREVGIVLSQNERQRLQNFIGRRNFGSLYAFFIEKLKSLRISEERLRVIDGEWKEFSEGSDPREVTQTLRGFSTGWCIAGEGYAASYLSRSNLYIYYSRDENGKAAIPRSCIVFNRVQNIITEVRGILPQQHFDDCILPVAEEKLKELPNGTRWLETMEDMKKLAAIHLKHLRNEELTENDLRFIYQLERPIKGFGYGEDARIQEILQNRDIKQDLSRLFNVSPDQISTIKEEALKGGIRYHYGDLDLSRLNSLKEVELPEEIGGHLILFRLTSLEKATLPERIGGHLILSRLTSLEKATLPERIGGHLNLYSLTSLENVTFPEEIGGDFNLYSLTSLENVTLPKTVGGDFNLYSLRFLENVTFPEEIGGDLNLDSLTFLENVTLPKTVGGDFNLDSLTFLENVTLPKTVGGDFNFDSLTFLENVTLPKTVGGDFNFDSLTFLENVTFPEEIGRDLNLYSLTSLENVTLPKTVGGDLNLDSLTFLENVTFPEEIGGYLYLSRLTSLENVTLPKTVGGYLYLSRLTSLENVTFPEEIGGNIFASSSFPEESIQFLKTKYGEDKVKII